MGKTLDEFYPKDVADAMMKNSKQVIQEKKLMEFEEAIVDLETGKTKYFLTARAPLFGDNGTDVWNTLCIDRNYRQKRS